MRNIKITALMLAVLMVVAAFAGCASKTAVSDLDNQVNELDGKLQEQANALAGIENSIKDLANAIGNTGSSEGLDDIKADVEANKQSVADILAAIEGLKDAVAGATGESEDVKTAINQAGAKIDALKGDFEDTKAHYTAENVAAIREAFGTAQAAISSCVTAEAVAAVVAAMEAELAKYVRVDDSIYNYYVALKGNITAESEDLVKEAKDAVNAAEKFYNKAFNNTKALTEYEYAEDETIDLVDAIEKVLYNQQFTELPVITKEAKDIVKLIDKALAGEKVDLAALRRQYKAFVNNAKELSEKNVELVTNADKLTVLIESSERVEDALLALKDEFDGAYASMLRATFNQDKDIFFDYKTLAATGEQSVITFLTKKGTKNAVGRTIAIYDEIDARLAKLAEAYELSEEGVALVVAQFTGDENFLAKYEADKALVKAFEAEYATLSEGVLADIADLTSEKLTVASASELAKKYEANADAINAWNKALVEAYEKAYKALDAAGKKKVSYDVAGYKALVLANFQVMVVEAQLVGWADKDADPDEYDWKHDAEFVYTGAFDDEKHNDGTNDFYYDLYDFTRADNKDLADFLTDVFPDANAAAKKFNEEIKKYRENQAGSIIDLVVNYGGYVYETTKDGEAYIAAIDTEADTFKGYGVGTIAWFVNEYKTENYDLSGLIDDGVALYEAKLATVEKNVEAAEAALAALMEAYAALLDEKSTVVVTMANADDIIALKALLVTVNATGDVDMKKATLDNTTVDGVKEYKVEALVADYLVGAETAKDFYNRVLLATNYADTTKGVANTGAITRLIYQAEALKEEAKLVASAYNMMAKLNGVFAGKAFAYANNYDGFATITKMNSTTYKNLATYGYMYGVISYEATSKVVGNTTEYGYKMTFVRFNAEKGYFYEGSRDSMATSEKYTTADAAAEGAWKYVKQNMIPGALTIANNTEFATYMFADNGFLKSTIKATDAEELNATTLKDKIVPAFALPMMAAYLEAKFMINNMGETAEVITTAKNGWGEPTSNYGFGYIKAMVVNQLRVTGKVNDSRLDAIGATANYDRLTVAVKSACQDSKLTTDVAFGAADADWLSKTYDLRVTDYAIGGYVDGNANAYAEHEIDLDKLVVEGFVVYEANTATAPGTDAPETEAPETEAPGTDAPVVGGGDDLPDDEF